MKKKPMTLAEREEMLERFSDTHIQIKNRFRADLSRQRPRDPIEAEYLKEAGTPDHLIGPIEPIDN